MDRTVYAKSSGLIRVYEKRMLNSVAADRAADAPSLADTLRLLSQETEYSFDRLKRPDDYEQLIKDSQRNLYLRAKELAVEDGVDEYLLEILFCKYDFHNLKVAFKAEHYPQRTESPYVHVTDVPPERLERLTKDLPETATRDADDEIPAHLAKAAALLRAALAKKVNPQTIDVMLDKAMFAYMTELAGKVETQMVSDYVRMTIDLYNIKTLLRSKEMQKGTAFLKEALADGGNLATERFAEQYGSPYTALSAAFAETVFSAPLRQGLDAFARTGNFSRLERLLDNVQIQLLKQVKYLAFGPELLFAYLMNKENEIRQIRIILACKQNNISPEALKERLRDNYV